MNSKFMKITACVLCAAVLSASSAAVAYAQGTKDAADATDSDVAVENVSETADEAAATKDETVYVIAGADGSVKKVIVSDWIKNNAKTSTLADVGSALSDVTNVRGDESYVMNDSNMRVWDAEGGDIYCQGTSDAELPVNIAVSYKLDGKTVSPDELAGKSGRVTMRFDYTNNLYETVEINGEEQKIYIPFVMLTGMILDNDKFTDIDVTNGRLINDGSRCIVAGLAMPGLQSDLAIDDDRFDLPDYVEISADVTDFSLMTTLTLATNEIFSDIDLTKTDDAVTELKASMTSLTDAMTALMDGSSQLYDGLKTLLEKSGDLIDGVNKLSDGAQALSAGADTLADGSAELAEKTGAAADGAAQLADGAADAANGAAQVSDGLTQLADGTAQVSAGAAQLSGGAQALAGYTGELSSGMQTLFAGLSQLSDNSQSLRDGAKTVFNTLLSTVEKQLTAAGLTVPATLTTDNYADVLDGITAQISEDNVRALATAKAKDTVTEKVTAETKNIVLAGVMQSLGMTADDYASLDSATQAQIDGSVAAQMATDGVKQQMSAAIDANMASATVQEMIEEAVQTAAAGRAQIAGAKAQLQSYQQFYDGLGAYTAGVDTAAKGEDSQKLLAGAVSIDGGMNEIAAGAANLAVGASEAKTGAATLADGAAALASGTATLSAGVDTLANGTRALAGGAADLASGAAVLDDGALTLKEGVLKLQTICPELASGINRLTDGAMKLSDGLKQFNEEGVLKLTGVGNDADAMLERVKAIVNASKDYQSYTGVGDNMDGSVRFVFKTDSIG